MIEVEELMSQTGFRIAQGALHQAGNPGPDPLDFAPEIEVMGRNGWESLP
jgi:hypothetical protein